MLTVDTSTIDTPDDTPSFDHSTTDSIDRLNQSVDQTTTQVGATTHISGQNLARSLASQSRGLGQSYAAEGQAITATFADIDLLASSIAAFNTFAGPVVAATASVATDPNLLASMPLSPITAAMAETAVLGSAARLTATLISTDALAVVTAAVVSTYQLADSTLSAAAATLGAGMSADLSIGFWAVEVGAAAAGGAGIMVRSEVVAEYEIGSATVNLLGATETLGATMTGAAAVALGSVAFGAMQEEADALRKATGEAWNARDDAGGMFSPAALIVGIGQRWGQNFSVSDVSEYSMNNFQTALGATGSLYDVVLGRLIHDGHTLGLFQDGNATVEQAPNSSERQIRAANTIAQFSWKQIHADNGGFVHNTEGLIEPRDVVSLLAGAAQIDQIGGDTFADIRIIKSDDGYGHLFYTVQIPSTSSWNPASGVVPNDVTSDVYAMRYHDQTALANAVREAMIQAKIPTGNGAPPVMMTGFSLGGITAGAIAAHPGAYNIQQLLTAGSPIGAMPISPAIHVVALEGSQDLVPTLDGASNPKTWTTVHQSGYPLVGEHNPTMTPVNVHDANRYAVMAINNPAVNNAPDITRFLGGNLTVTDYAAVRG